MQIANIYPIKNQELYRDEQTVMILAHLVQRKLYNPANFNDLQYIIMDNGLFEKAQVSTKLIDCIELAENSGIPVREIVVPDAANFLEETIDRFEENLETIRQWNHKYRFMFVAQAVTYEQLRQAFKYISKYHKKGLRLSVGVSKLSPLDRRDPRAIKIYSQSVYPIHFLGIKESFSELTGAAPYIRSCDSSQIAYIVKNEKEIPRAINTYKRSKDETLAIDLEEDYCNPKKIIECRNRLLSIEVPNVIL